jgi:glycosyltransferase involved in cell wall biosynthesis
MKRKKILWLSHLVPYPPKGGVLQRSYNLLKELARYHDVYLLALIQPGLAGSQEQSLDDFLVEAERHLGKFCARVKFFKLPHLQKRHWKPLEAARALLLNQSYTISWLRCNEANLQVSEWHKAERFDVVHCDTISLMPMALQCNGAKVGLNHHNIESHMLFRRSSKERNLFAKIYFYLEARKVLSYEKRWCPLADVNLTCSDLDAERLREIVGPIRTSVVENGVDLSYFDPDPHVPVKDGSLIFAGGLGWYPNRDAMRHFVTDIWPLIAREHPGCVMNLVGRGRDDQISKATLDYPGQFVIHGFVDDVRSYLSTAAVYVCPIRDGGGTKLKMLDAMAMKKAIVAYSEACEGLGVEDGKHVIIVDSAADFAKSVISLFFDEGRRVALGDEARRLVEEKYSFESIGHGLADLYASI